MLQQLWARARSLGSAASRVMVTSLRFGSPDSGPAVRGCHLALSLTLLSAPVPRPCVLIGRSCAVHALPRAQWSACRSRLSVGFGNGTDAQSVLCAEWEKQEKDRPHGPPRTEAQPRIHLRFLLQPHTNPRSSGLHHQVHNSNSKTPSTRMKSGLLGLKNF